MHPTDEPITIDCETIPDQDAARKEAMFAAEREAAKAEIAAVAPPSNWKDETKIAEWWETTGNKKKAELFFAAEEKAEQAWRRTALNAAHGQLAVVSIQPGAADPILIFDTGHSYREPGYEAWLLNEVNKTLELVLDGRPGQFLLGHNLEFDRKFLRQRGVINGVKMHRLVAAILRPWDDGIVDTMHLWTGDHRDRIKLDVLCEIFGLDMKGAELEDGETIDGSLVWDFIERGEIEKVAKYCGGDTGRAYRAWRRMRLLDPIEIPKYIPTYLRESAEAH